RDGAPLARNAAEGRTRASVAHVTGRVAPRRADDGARPALEARGAGLHPRDPRDARRDDPPVHARPPRGRGAERPRRHPRPRPARRSGSRRRAEGGLRRRHARGGGLRGHRSRIRRRGRGREERGIRMSTIPGPLVFRGSLRHEAITFAGVVERNWYLIKRYFWWELAFFVWSLANTLTIVFIAKGVKAAGGQIDVNRATTTLLIGAVIWSYLGIVFEFMTETVAWERWEGTIEYTFMAPLRRSVPLFGVGFFSVAYGVFRSAVLFAVEALFFGLHMPDANFIAAIVVLAVASVSFIGVGTMTSVLPLISPEKGAQLGFVAQGMLLV